MIIEIMTAGPANPEVTPEITNIPAPIIAPMASAVASVLDFLFSLILLSSEGV